MGLTAEEEALAWAAAGAAWLTGRPDGPPLGPPVGMVTRLVDLAARIADRSGAMGRRVELDPLGVLVERAALAGLARGGEVSCGGATRLLPTADGDHVALSLARPDDWDLLAALFRLDVAVEPGDWTRVATLVAAEVATELVDRGAHLLGLPLARLGELGNQDDRSSPWFPSSTGGGRAERCEELLVVDLAGLWAGPLAASVLADAGARVVKVESTARPDGGRAGQSTVFDLLNAGKRSVALDLRSADGRDALLHLVDRADVVVSAARARALAHLGLQPASTVGSRVWLSVTGYGLGEDRVAFGDDAAAAGGLVVRDERGPCFCADAVADPLAGLVGAAAVLDSLAVGQGGLIDVSMVGVAASFGGPTVPLPEGIEVASPTAGRRRGPAPPLGADTDAVLHEVGWRG
jgi:crotonobetainyl-CoA:carnitine CoA-transferase CaiB-like acyl-CoA transferase